MFRIDVVRPQNTETFAEQPPLAEIVRVGGSLVSSPGKEMVGRRGQKPGVWSERVRTLPPACEGAREFVCKA